MSNKEIEDQINNDLYKFENEIYKGKIDVPENILKLFKKGISSLPAQTHGIHFTRIKVICSKLPNELTISEINQVVRIIVCAPFATLYYEILNPNENLIGIKNEDDNFLNAVDEQIRLEKFILSYNTFVSEFQERLKMKKTNLLSLASGVNGDRMRVIN